MILVILVILLSVALPKQCGAQVKHPQEMDMSDLEDDIELMSWTERRTSKMDCDTFYRRLVKHLFNKKRFHADPNSDHYIASVPLRLRQEQWELLVELNTDGLNLNELDNLIEEVLKQSNNAEWDYPVSQILFDHYRHQIVESLPSINSPIVLVVIAILAIILMNRVFHFSKLKFSAIIFFGFLGICVISYSMMYWDCQSDLEVEQMIQLSKKQSNNPCKNFDGEHSSFLSSLRAKIFGSSENECLEYMRKTFKSSKKYCDPLDVFAKWFGKIQMSYFSSIFGGFFELVSSMTSSSNLLTKIVLWVVCPLVFVFIFLSFGKEVIIHVCKGMLNTSTTTHSTPDPHKQSSSDFHRLNSKMDEILQENQEMKRFIREVSVERSKSIPARIEDTKRLTDINEESP